MSETDSPQGPLSCSTALSFGNEGAHVSSLQSQIVFNSSAANGAPDLASVSPMRTGAFGAERFSSGSFASKPLLRPSVSISSSRWGFDARARYAGTVLEHPLIRLTGQYTVLDSHSDSVAYSREPSNKSAPDGAKTNILSSSIRRMSSIMSQQPSSNAMDAYGADEQYDEEDPNRARRAGYRQERTKSRMQKVSSFQRVASLGASVLPSLDRRNSTSSDSSGETANSRATSGVGVPDEDSEATVEPAVYLRLYLSVGFLLLLTLSDLVSCLVLQMLWAPSDFLCTRRPRADGSAIVDWQPVNMAVMVALQVMHVLYMLQQILHADADGRAVGMRYFVSRELFAPWSLAVNSLHLWTCVASLLLLTWHAKLCATSDCRDSPYMVVRRFHLVLHVFRVGLAVHFCWRLVGDIRRRLQRAVSNTKRRYVDRDAKIDLDLTYIADRLLSMSLPCIEHAPYRNDIRDVSRFFATRHYGSFVVVNLCEAQEEGGNGNYHPDLLYGQVQRVPMRDHNAPTLQALIAVCEAASDFLNRKSDNAIAIHCQGGKGRTGLFNCALMLWTGFADSAEEAQKYFRRRRTQPGVERSRQQRIASPSQIRYLEYVERVIFSPIDPAGFHPVLLKRIRVFSPPGVDAADEQLHLSLVIERHSVVLYDHCKAHGPISTATAASNNNLLDIDVGNVLLDGDISVRLYALKTDHTDRVAPGTSVQVKEAGRAVKYGSVKGRLVCFISLHTAFIDGDVCMFPRSKIDGCHKPERLSHFRFHKDFAIAFEVQRPPSLWPQTAGNSTPLSFSRCSSGGGRAFSNGVEHSPGTTGFQRTHSDKTQPAPSSVPEGDAIVSAADIPPLSPLPRSGGVNSLRGGEVDPAEQSVVLHERLFAILKERGAPVHKFRCGESVPDSFASERDHLVVVVAGCVELEIGGMAYGALGLVDDPSLVRVGRGQLLGTLGLRKLGFDSLGTVTVCRVKSDMATIAKLPLQSIGEGRCSSSGSVAEPYSEDDLCTLYQVLCRHMVGWSYSLARLQATVHSSSNAKVDPSNTIKALTSQLHKQVSQHHALPISEKVLKSVAASLMENKKVNGRLILFQDFLIFCPNGGNRSKDLVIKLASVRKVSATREGLLLVLRPTLRANSQARHRSISPEAASASRPVSQPVAGSVHISVPRNNNSFKNIAPADGAPPPAPLSMPTASLRSQQQSGTPSEDEASSNSDEGDPRASKSFRSLMMLKSLGSSVRSLAAAPDNLSPPLTAVPRAMTLRRRGTVANGADVRRGRGRGLSITEGGQQRGTEVLFSLHSHDDAKILQAKISKRVALLREKSHAEVEAIAPDQLLQHFGFEDPDDALDTRESDALRAMLTNNSVRHYSAGEEVIQQGEVSRRISFVLSGTLQAKSADGTLATRTAGHVVGERMFFEVGNRGATSTVVAETDAVVLTVDSTLVAKLAAAHPSAAARFFRVLARTVAHRVQGQLDRLADACE